MTEGHRGIIYRLSWTQNDQLLASASADGLVKYVYTTTLCTHSLTRFSHCDRVWSWTSSTASEPMAVLPHPCYVYAVCFSNSDDTDQLVFTGAYDNAIRVWSIANDSNKVLRKPYKGTMF